MPSTPIAGWLQCKVAELPQNQGGLSMPNVVTELLALGAKTVEAWALTTNTTIKHAGDILRQVQAEDGTEIFSHVVPRPKQLPAWKARITSRFRRDLVPVCVHVIQFERCRACARKSTQSM